MELQELIYPIRVTTGGLVPNFADDASPVWNSVFVGANPDISVPGT